MPFQDKYQKNCRRTHLKIYVKISQQWRPKAIVTKNRITLVEWKYISFKLPSNFTRSLQSLARYFIIFAESCKILGRNVFLVRFFQIVDFLQDLLEASFMKWLPGSIWQGMCWLARYMHRFPTPEKILQEFHFLANVAIVWPEMCFFQLSQPCYALWCYFKNVIIR